MVLSFQHHEGGMWWQVERGLHIVSPMRRTAKKKAKNAREVASFNYNSDDKAIMAKFDFGSHSK